MNVINFHSLLTLIFFVTFIGMVIWVYLPARKGSYEKAAELPFAGDNATDTVSVKAAKNKTELNEGHVHE